MEQEPDQMVPEIQNPEPTSETRKKPKKRKTKKKNFGNKAKKRNQRNYRKFPAIRVEQQPQEDENFPYVPLDDMDPAEPVDGDNPLPLKGKKIKSEVLPQHKFDKKSFFGQFLRNFELLSSPENFRSGSESRSN